MSLCTWKMVPYDQFTLGMEADRCSKEADVRVLRPYRKTDLFLCESHLNDFIDTWGLHNHVEILCNEPRCDFECGDCYWEAKR